MPRGCILDKIIINFAGETRVYSKANRRTENIYAWKGAGGRGGRGLLYGRAGGFHIRCRPVGIRENDDSQYDRLYRHTDQRLGGN